MPEGRYRPLLCLVQVVVGEEVWVLDPLVGFEAAPLAAVLADPEIEIVVHAGRQDVAILRREWGTDVANVFDTQVAAGFAGFSAQAGYNGLLHDVLKIRLPKTASFTRWDARPLTDEQLRYARGDVEHLLPLADDIRSRLEASGRLEWAREECRAVAQASDERDPEEVWRRLPRATGLDPRERAVARELGAWRERTAERENRPVGAVLRDPTVIELAKRTPGAARSWPRSAASARTSCGAAATTSSPPSAAAAPPSRSASTRPTGCRPSRRTARSSRSPRRSCAAAPRRPGSRTS